MRNRYKFTFLGVVLGLAAMPVTIVLVWGVLLALGWTSLAGLHGFILPVSILIGILVAGCLSYQGYRIDRNQALSSHREGISRNDTDGHTFA